MPGILTLGALGASLSVDAFAAALGKGAQQPKARWGDALRIGLVFGFFEAVTPALVAELAAERPTATETEIGWTIVEEISLEAAAMLRPAYERVVVDPPVYGVARRTVKVRPAGMAWRRVP